jgi:DNA adenine methylase
MKAPFQYFGGKARVAHIVWQALGDVEHYVEPFAGSLAALLARPAEHSKKNETVNDADGLLCNFWRAVQYSPEQVARHAKNPPFECDLLARHRWLMGKRTEITTWLKEDPFFFDARAAGWWVWGISNWYGSGFTYSDFSMKMPQLPHGVMGFGVRDELPKLFESLRERLKNVRVCSGDWHRVVASNCTVTGVQKTHGVFLDPPYSSNRAECYAEDSFDNTLVHRWCLDWQDKTRIVLAGHEGEYDLPGWRKFEWKQSGGLARNAGAKKTGGIDRASLERLWISPLCNEVTQ